MRTTLKRLLILLLSITLTACMTAPQPSIKTSLAPVHTLVPTVECNEDAPDAELPDYPVGPTLRRADIASFTVDQLRTAAYGLYDYSAAQQHWAVSAAGVVADEHTLRHNTLQCLDGLRARGLIN